MVGVLWDRSQIPTRRVVGGFALSAALLAGLVYLVDVDDLLTELGRANLAVFALGPLAILGAMIAWTEGQRRMLLASDVELGHLDTFLPLCAGTFLRLIVPMGNVGGPAIIAYAVGRQTGRNYEEDLAPVSIGEMTSLVASLVVAAGGILLFFGTTIPTRSVWILAVGVATLAGVVVATGLLLFYRQAFVQRSILSLAGVGRSTLGRVSTRVHDRLAPAAVTDRLEGFFGSFNAVSDQRRTVVVSFCFYFLGWVLFTVPLYTAFRSLGHDVSVEFVLFLVPASGVANVFPMPGGLGAAESVLVGIITQLLAVPASAALAVVFLYQVSAYWFMLLVAGVGSVLLSLRTGDR